MANIVWLAGYPKSGNTWLRFIVANLILGKVESSEAVSRVVPDFHVRISSQDLQGDRVLVLKSHLKYFGKMPLREDTVGVVYIVRNPLDVVISTLNYHELFQGQLDEERREALIEEFVVHGGLKEWKQFGFGAWDEHVTSWHATDMPFPRLTLRYEDLKTNPVESVSQLCRFLQITPSEEQISDVIAASSFGNLRAMEDREIAAGRRGLFVLESRQTSGGKRFMNQGATDAYREALSDDQIRRLRERFGPLMSKVGYP